VNPPLGSVARASSNPAATLLRGAAGPTLLAVVALSLAAVLVSPAAAASVLVGAAMAVAALLTAPALQMLSRNLDPSLVLGLAVLVYGTVVGLLWIGFSLLNDASWLIGGFAGGGVLAVAMAWSIGHMRAAIKLRQPLYQDGELPLGDK
jgi:hypothetical protein